MIIELKDLGKKYAREWIFKGVNLTLESGKAYAVIGGNGSGKSTFLKLLAGISHPSKGEIKYIVDTNKVEADEIWKHLVLAGPYTELIEEFTLVEHLKFHASLKKMTKPVDEIIEILGLEKSKNKQIQDFSSGMKQKLKLALAFFTEASILFLDEPTSNLDQRNIEWYQDWLPLVSNNKIVVICSNQVYEYEYCNERISIESYKK
ncbi:ABC transporter ATP-binding protein [Flammeovirga kamogawensis]|uniref:ABC transporter ATP-binding protein n=1 Tax=Flammeovirga kamogawensis TaxID=373891 RepID=A0ABX8GTL6_9BACT|nr:ABC transporter ATP-binding protein [Flammeovirga kamogawensis]MBB6463375.1 ABC-type multidrug transport system ATPase subunit [Flammeovirga kamogawensis]QWG06653.1 ABC transporter ATP-binding protein [Flammeovirga kamogawensis]